MKKENLSFTHSGGIADSRSANVMRYRLKAGG